MQYRITFQLFSCREDRTHTYFTIIFLITSQNELQTNAVNGFITLFIFHIVKLSKERYTQVKKNRPPNQPPI